MERTVSMADSGTLVVEPYALANTFTVSATTKNGTCTKIKKRRQTCVYVTGNLVYACIHQNYSLLSHCDATKTQNACVNGIRGGLKQRTANTPVVSRMSQAGLSPPSCL